MAVFTALDLEAQTWSNVGKGDNSYVTIQNGQNYALKTNQIVKVVGVGAALNQYEVPTAYPTIIGSFPDGSTTAIGGYESQIGMVGMIFTGLTNVSLVGGPATGMAATLEITTPPCYNPNTLPVIPQGGSALLQVQSTYNLASGQWTTIYSQAFTNSTGSNQFFAITLSAAP